MLRLIIKSLLNLFRLVDYKTVWIDGGLGSQIIAYIIYHEKQKKNNDQKCNIAFYNKSKLDSEREDFTFREWKLDYYGINMSSLNSQNSKFSIRPNTKTQGKLLYNFFEELKPQNWLEIFPINNEFINNPNAPHNLYDKYTAIHIRRGDFLKYATHIISDEKFLLLLDKTKNILNEKIYIVSDDNFEDDFKIQLSNILANNNVEFISSGNDIEIHNILRLSNILITSNSMFSLSAALLQKEGGISIVPEQFYGKNEKSFNNAINCLSDWKII